MTLTELLEFVRRVELRKNRFMPGAAVNLSSNSPVEFGRISCAVKNGNDGKCLVLDGKIEGVFLKATEADFLRATAHPLKMPGIYQRALERRLHFQLKLVTEPRALRFIPGNRCLEFQMRSGLKNNRQAHRQPKRLLSSASICSQGIPWRGFFSNSARRRSSSAACSGVRSSAKPPYFSATFSATSCCSSGGSRSICLRISAALMRSIYPVDLLMQAGVCAQKTCPFFRPARKSCIVYRKSAP